MAKRDPSQARRDAVRRHDAEKVDKVTVRLPKGTADKIRGTGASVNAFIIAAVLEKLQKT